MFDAQHCRRPEPAAIKQMHRWNFPEVKLNFNATSPVKLSCQASKMLICCLPSAGSGSAAHCAASPAPRLAELHTPLPHILEMLQVKYRGKFDTAWNLSRWKALLDARVEGRRVVSGFRSSCHVLSRGRISNFWCAVSLHFWKWENTISVIFLNTERAPFLATAFVKKVGGWLPWHGLPPEREKSAWMWQESS